MAQRLPQDLQVYWCFMAVSLWRMARGLGVEVGAGPYQGPRQGEDHPRILPLRSCWRRDPGGIRLTQQVKMSRTFPMMSPMLIHWEPGL